MRWERATSNFFNRKIFPVLCFAVLFFTIVPKVQAATTVNQGLLRYTCALNPYLACPAPMFPPGPSGLPRALDSDYNVALHISISGAQEGNTWTWNFSGVSTSPGGMVFHSSWNGGSNCFVSFNVLAEPVICGSTSLNYAVGGNVRHKSPGVKAITVSFSSSGNPASVIISESYELVALESNISLTNAQITQAVFDTDGIVDLVLSRRTAALLTYDAIDLVNQSVAVEVRMVNEQGETVATFPTDPPFVTPQMDGQNLKAEVFFTPDRTGSYNLIVALDPANIILETDETDNLTETPIPVKLHETKNLTIAYVPLIPPICFLNNCLMTQQDVQNSVSESNDFIQRTYPLADDGLQFDEVNLDNRVLGGNNEKRKSSSPPCGPEGSVSEGIFQDFATLDTMFRGKKRIIGIVPEGYFAFHFLPDIGGLQIAGYKSILGQAGYPQATVHELGHSFGLPVPDLTQTWFSEPGKPKEPWEEYYLNPETCKIPSPDPPDIGFLVDGFDVKNKKPVNGALDFMGYGAWEGEYWIAKLHWDKLLQQLSIDVPDPELIQISAIIYKDGRTKLGPWGVFDGIPDVVEPGEYSLELLNANGEPILNIPFKLSFFMDIEEVGRVETPLAGFSYAVPYPPETATVLIKAPDGTVLAEVDPVQKTLTDAITNLPGKCFTEEASQQRQLLIEDIEIFNGQLEASDVNGALSKLEIIRSHVETFLKNQCGIGSETTEGFLSLIEEIVSRLENRISGSTERCGNCQDDDGDTFVDLLDPDCQASALAVSRGTIIPAPAPSEDKLTLQGSFSAPAGSINPATDGVTVNLTDSDGPIACFKLPPGAGWKTQGTKWSFMDNQQGSLGNPDAKEILSIQYNAKKGTFTVKAKVKKTSLSDPDAGNISTSVVIGEKGFLNTQAWQLDKTGKKFVTPVKSQP